LHSAADPDRIGITPFCCSRGPSFAARFRQYQCNEGNCETDISAPLWFCQDAAKHLKENDHENDNDRPAGFLPVGWRLGLGLRRGLSRQGLERERARATPNLRLPRWLNRRLRNPSSRPEFAGLTTQRRLNDSQGVERNLANHLRFPLPPSAANSVADAVCAPPYQIATVPHVRNDGRPRARPLRPQTLKATAPPTRQRWQRRRPRWACGSTA